MTRRATPFTNGNTVLSKNSMDRPAGEYSGKEEKLPPVNEDRAHPDKRGGLEGIVTVHRDIFPCRRIDWRERKDGMPMELWRRNLQMAVLFGCNIALIILAQLG